MKYIKIAKKVLKIRKIRKKNHENLSSDRKMANLSNFPHD